MEKIIQNQEFWDIADSFVELANEHAESSDADIVSAAMLYATSHYNAYVLSAVEKESVELADKVPEYIETLVDQYRELLCSAFEDYRQQSSLKDE